MTAVSIDKNCDEATTSQSPSPPRVGHQYQGQHISGSAKVHLGDVNNFNSVIENPLSRLPCAAQAAFNSSNKQRMPLCFPDTRTDVLTQIRGWVAGRHQRCIFWLNGMAGTGKSTIARTIATEYYKGGQLGASYFFSRGGGDLGSSQKLFTTIATQLASKSPDLKRRICEAVTKDTGIGDLGLDYQWKHLILEPLSMVEDISLSSPLVLVIDALDKCDDEEDVQLVLQLLATARSLQNVQLRIFVTSRPESAIRYEVDNIPRATHQDYILHHMSPAEIEDDISIIFKHYLEIIRQKCKLPSEWPEEEDIRDLVRIAGGLPIYASTICRFVGEDTRLAVSRLTLVLQHGNHALRPEKELDKTYTTVLTHSVYAEYDKQEREKLQNNFVQIVGSIVLLFDTLPAVSLAKFLQTSKEQIDQTLTHLHSVLDVPEDQNEKIQLLHPSFRDFLLDNHRCMLPQFWINEKPAHQYLFSNCLTAMSNHLRRNICQLQSPGALTAEIDRSKVDRFIPLHIQYACRFWFYHFQQSNVDPYDCSKIQKFLQEHFLHWLEALAVMDCISDAVIVVKSLASMFQSNTKAHATSLSKLVEYVFRSKLRSQENSSLGDHKAMASSALSAFAYDAKRFILNNASIMGVAPLQAYCSAIIFSPRTSIIRKTFWDEVPLWIERSPGVQEDWNSCLQALEGHSDSVTSVAFSPDGKLVASGSCDKTVRLWDSTTGKAQGTLEGHSDWVISGAFSPDGKLVASGSWDKTVRLWDATTGKARGMLEGHSSKVTSVAFSPDGRLVASGSHDKTVRLWDAATGKAQGTLEGHSSKVTSVAFSPDGKLIALGSYNKTVRLWDAATGKAQGTLEGHSEGVTLVAFSPDGKLVASGSWDKTVRLWDTATGKAQGTLEGHSDCVASVAFSPDGKLVASGSYDKTVRLWDTATGKARGMLEGHSNCVTSVAFSPDGKLVASGSWDRTVRLWDATTGKVQGTLELGIKTTNLSFSALGQYLKTNKGVLDVSSLLQISSDSLEHASALYVLSNWVAEKGESILWLPPNYRAICVAVWNGIMVMGHSSGCISFLEFKQGLKTV